MAVQSINVPKLPRPLQTVLFHMAIDEIQEVSRRARGSRLNQLLDAASVSHPDYFDPTLKGVY